MATVAEPSTNGKPATYKSKAQVSVSAMRGQTNKVEHAPPLCHKDYDLMMRDPTIKIAIEIVTALAMKEPWIVEGEDQQCNDFIYRQIEPYRKSILRSSLIGFIRRGWRAFESRYDFETVDGTLRQVLTGVKSLRPERTWKVIDPQTGDMLGLLHQQLDNTNNLFTEAVFIDAQHSVFVNQDDDGYGEYGWATLEAAWRPWTNWRSTDEGAMRYDQKVAGGFLVIKYPVGTTSFSEGGGTKAEIDNSRIADIMGASLESAGIAKIPVKVVDDLTGTDLPEVHDQWKIEHVAPSAGLQPNFVIRAKYQDALKMRAFGLPERSATEGTLGTKAEAEAHADIAMLVNHERHDRIVDAVNSQLVRPLNESNWGNPGACRLNLGELDNSSRELFSQVFIALMSDPIMGDNVAMRVDIDSLLDKLQIPIRVGGGFAQAPDVGAGAQ